jgi:cytochrome c oxidase assembly protein subunit 15
MNRRSALTDRAVARWLMVVAAMVFIMVVLGGLTRLTHSGLSMVEWRPLTGWLPPLSEAEWQMAFDAYRQTPEYREINRGMSLMGFKEIFWLEYVHRLWGRLIGVAFLIPALYFLARRYLDRPLALTLAGLFVLGGLQGALGWFMVQSGLVDRPDVSQYRLAAHLGLAVVIYAAILWVAFRLVLAARPRTVTAVSSQPTRLSGLAVLALIFLTIIAGAFVAGIDAGFAYNTFPTMDGEWLPSGIVPLAPWYRNFFEDITTVQFTHRVLATLTVVAVLAWAWAMRRATPSLRCAGVVTAAFALAQYALGALTVVLVVPVPIAAMHQVGALALFTAALWTTAQLPRRSPQVAARLARA